jgi:hypothetical protein
MGPKQCDHNKRLITLTVQQSLNKHTQGIFREFRKSLVENVMYFTFTKVLI